MTTFFNQGAPSQGCGLAMTKKHPHLTKKHPRLSVITSSFYPLYYNSLPIHPLLSSGTSTALLSLPKTRWLSTNHTTGITLIYFSSYSLLWYTVLLICLYQLSVSLYPINHLTLHFLCFSAIPKLLISCNTINLYDLSLQLWKYF